MSSDEGASRAGPDRPLAEDHVAERIKLEREARGWSTVTLAERMADAGHPVNQSAIWRIESGKPRRRVNLDEALGFCKVFDLTFDELTSPLASSPTRWSVVSSATTSRDGRNGGPWARTCAGSRTNSRRTRTPTPTRKTWSRLC